MEDHPSTPTPHEPLHPSDALDEVRVRAPARGNRRLEALLEAVTADERLKAWWRSQDVTATRLGTSDHSWLQIVLNVALRLLRLLARRGVEPAMVSDHAMRDGDAEVVVAYAALPTAT